MTSSLLRGAVLAAAGFVLSVQADAKSPDAGVVDMGTTERVTNLVSYPNCTGSQCPAGVAGQTLPQTVDHYLQQSLQRSLLKRPKVAVTSADDHVLAAYKGDGKAENAAVLKKFLDNGQLAYDATQQIKADGKWENGWTFFLPWGLDIVDNPTLELLHFPPDYSLTGQDYLNAKTTERWGALLEYMYVPAREVNSYQAIIDIAPIAADSNAGSQITNAGVYGYYMPYVDGMLSWWAVDHQSQKGKPMVAFGGPVRDWLKAYMNLTLTVDQVGTATLKNGVTVPVMAANHPSLIFYAAYNKDGSENFDGGMKVMRQDMISACWQAEMGKHPASDGAKVGTECTTRWSNNTYDVCMELETTIYQKSWDQAHAVCQPGGALTKLQEPSDEEIQKLER
ncbi:MAG TPA: hypothetical protein VM661_00650 [Candidatus Sulfotelmatobacter sp.]|jgi:hypothetical protein|nr:hypothetical protein [Candidatus Sulfotelmatobacter sp.]